MSKNIARKGLVFGALVALSSSVIAGAPAQAAELLTLAPSTGTSYNTVQGSNFVLETQFDSTISSSSVPYLKYRVTNDAAKALTFGVGKAGVLNGDDTAIATGETAATKYVGYKSLAISALTFNATTDKAVITVASNPIVAGQTVSFSGLAGTPDATAIAAGSTQAKLNAVLAAISSAPQTAIATSNSTTITVQLADGVSNSDFGSSDFTSADAGVAVTGTAVSNNTTTLVTTSADFVVQPSATDAAAVGSTSTLTLSTSDTKATVGVQSFLDLNNNNKIDSGEAVSAIRTVNFLEASTVTASAKFQPVLAGATTLKADVTLSGDVNYGQLAAGAYTVVFKSKDATDYTNAMGLSASTAQPQAPLLLFTRVRATRPRFT
jgi:hypothetical protein